MQVNKLIKYTLDYNEKKSKWELENDKTDKIVKTFETKGSALSGGVLKKILGGEGGSVKIKKLDGKYGEERTYPKSKDPIESRG